MCTSIIEIVPAEGMAKRGDAWFGVSQAVVAYDHGGVGEILRAMFPQGAVPVGDVRAAADVIERIEKQGLRVERRNAFPLTRMLDETIQLYEDIAAVRSTD